MAVAALPRVYALSMRQLYTQVIADVRDGKAGTIHPELYRVYSENLRGAVSGVLGASSYGDKYSDMQSQFEANTDRFAAYKAFHATQQLERQLADRDGVARSPEEFDRMARAVLNTFNRYQAAEYNTAVARARTAKQWADFSQGDNMFLFPNIRWLPSRSANPREQHMPFYNRVWAKTDPFWNSNQPGNLWNCKCDWEETDDPVTGDNPEGIRPARGLEGNPAETSQIFTDECTYIKKAGQNRRQREEVEKNCERVSQNLTSSVNKQAMAGKSTTCSINGTEHEVLFEPIGIEHYAQDCFGNKELFWIKNEILPIIDKYIQKARCTAKKRSDVSHNTSRKTLRLKRQTSYFYYFPVTLPNQQSAVLHLGMYNSNKIGKEGKMYLYSITKNMPDNIETP